MDATSSHNPYSVFNQLSRSSSSAAAQMARAFRQYHAHLVSGTGILPVSLRGVSPLIPDLVAQAFQPVARTGETSMFRFPARYECT
jgi:hypothetical protein